ncbi:hypothetical protein S-CBS2_gp009 [Synechococcus phage S-CBS2]|uniref:hypothetical protein n=1 Tax=Synechococcus phage S-CBS2 TaxID=753084 RepID=UPI00020783E2|nr:hypothetical protein S-CBS2_gp009 [Synechococcus phage S-CBS2]ADF42365.1 hypothetical protein S-CBS2_gp009 [Synechococcus phage S-CBS2]
MLKIGKPIPSEIQELLQKYLTKADLKGIEGVNANYANMIRYDTSKVVTENNNAFAAWATAVNLNAGMASRQIVEVYDPTQATTPGTDFGFVFNMKKADNSDLFFMHYVSGTSIYFGLGDVHTTGATNGGFGTLTAPTSADWASPSSFAYITADNAAATDVWIGTSTVDGEEFFALAMTDGINSGDGNYFILGKDQDNQWCHHQYQTTSSWRGNGVYTDGTLAEIGSSSSTNTHPFTSTTFLTIPFVVELNNYTFQTGPAYKKFFGYASPDIGYCQSISYAPGNYVDMGDGSIFVALMADYGPWIRYTPTV